MVTAQPTGLAQSRVGLDTARAEPRRSTPRLAEDVSRDRQRHALEAVLGWRSAGERVDDMRSKLAGLPIQLRTQGLAVTVAWLARPTAPRFMYSILAALNDWLATRALGVELSGGARDLLPNVVRAERDMYLAAQRESLLFFEELKRMSALL